MSLSKSSTRKRKSISLDYSIQRERNNQVCDNCGHTRWSHMIGGGICKTETRYVRCECNIFEPEAK